MRDKNYYPEVSPLNGETGLRRKGHKRPLHEIDDKSTAFFWITQIYLHFFAIIPPFDLFPALQYCENRHREDGICRFLPRLHRHAR